jgi:hypothetical protein
VLVGAGWFGIIFGTIGRGLVEAPLPRSVSGAFWPPPHRSSLSPFSARWAASPPRLPGRARIEAATATASVTHGRSRLRGFLTVASGRVGHGLLPRLRRSGRRGDVVEHDQVGSGKVLYGAPKDPQEGNPEEPDFRYQSRGWDALAIDPACEEHKVSPRVPTNLVADLLKELAANPLDDLEVGQLYNPAMVPDLLPEEALSLEADGMPSWFPTAHPETLAPLTQEQRRRWLLDVLEGELSVASRPFHRAERRWWLRSLAQSRCSTCTRSGRRDRSLHLTGRWREIYGLVTIWSPGCPETMDRNPSELDGRSRNCSIWRGKWTPADTSGKKAIELENRRAQAHRGSNPRPSALTSLMRG